MWKALEYVCTKVNINGDKDIHPWSKTDKVKDEAHKQDTNIRKPNETQSSQSNIHITSVKPTMDNITWLEDVKFDATTVNF